MKTATGESLASATHPSQHSSSVIPLSRSGTCQSPTS
jgi:hypothetical protein